MRAMRRHRDSAVTATTTKSWEEQARYAARIRLQATRAERLPRRNQPSKLAAYLRRLSPERQQAAAADLRAWVIQYLFTHDDSAPRRRVTPVDGLDIAAMLDDLLGTRTDVILAPALKGEATRGRWREAGIGEAREAIHTLRRAQPSVGPKVACRLVAEQMRGQWADDNATCDELIACNDNTLERKLYDACYVNLRVEKARKARRRFSTI